MLNADDPRVAAFRDVHPGRRVTFGFAETADVRAEDAELRADGARFRVRGVAFETGLAGRHAVMNLLAAIAVAGVFGIAPETPARCGAHVRRGQDARRAHRAQRHRDLERLLQLQSRGRAVHARRAARRRRRRSAIAVLGEMLELGSAAEELHRRVGRYAAERGIDLLIGVRGSARAMVPRRRKQPGLRSVYFEDPAEAGEFARRQARPGDAVLFKGSRGVKVERALERFLA